MKKVLLLGAGLVTRPLVHYLLEAGDVELNVGSRTVSKAQALVGKHPRGRAFALNVDSDAELEAAVAANDLVISLVPYTYHVAIAKHCIKHGKDMVTTSYVSPAMRALDPACKKAGILILNEIGLDPGIDHMSAMQIINKVEKKGGKVTAFKSYCGGLPAPEANDNPLGYKFSWSPRGVLMAGRNQGRYLQDGRMVEVPNAFYFADHRRPEVMWEAPARLGTGYDGTGYEISAAGQPGVEAALDGWQSSPGHDAILAGRGAWRGVEMRAIGIGVETSPGPGPYAGGTVYRMTEEQTLRFEIMRNDTLGIRMGGTSGVEIPFFPIKLHDELGD